MAAPEIMTAEEVAEMLRCSVAHVQRQAKRGEIPAKKVGYLWRFRRSVIERWFDGISSRTKEETQ